MTKELINWHQSPDKMSNEELIFFITRSSLALEAIKNDKLCDIDYNYAKDCHKRYTDNLSSRNIK